MEWEGREQSENVEDRRGMGGTVAAGGGVLALVVGVIAYFVTGDPEKAKQIADHVPHRGVQHVGPAPNDKMTAFASTILGMTEKVWGAEFQGMGKHYENPHMVLFSERVQTGCGDAPSAVGPFYCPADKIVYLDPTFFDELEKKLGGSAADFSKAYVIAHEVGHHVQNLLGYSKLADKGPGHQGSVRLELQADYLAGVWANKADKKYNKLLQPGDVESAIKSAKAIGDDKLQKEARGWVSPESFTHGTSAQRVKYFTEGLNTGDASKSRLDRFFTLPYNDL